MAQFLSEEWLDQARAIREEYADDNQALAQDLKMNLIIKNCPEEVGSDGLVDAHIDLSSDAMEMELGHMEAPQVTVTLSYDVAKAFLIKGDPNAAVSAFMAGQVQVTGDMTKLMGLAQGGAQMGSPEMTEKLQAITD